MNEPYFKDKLIITGHTITFTLPGIKPGQIAAGVGWLDIDTGAYHPNSGWLTGLDLTQNKVYQVNAKELTVRTLPLKRAVAQVEIAKIFSKRSKRRA
jgi:serine/threonine protein phosphatase 1